MRIRSHLLLLSAIVLVPGFVAATVAVEKVREGERDAALRGLREAVRSTALLVDAEVQRSIGALTALGGSPSLATGDFASLYREAQRIDQPPDVWTLLLDDTGLQRLNTHVPYGQTAPAAAAGQRVAQTLASGKPFVSDLFIGPVTQSLLTTIYVPAQRDAQGRRFVVAQAFSVEHWKRTALATNTRRDWLIGVLDRQGNFIARSVRGEELVGRPARPELVSAAAAMKEGLIRHRTLEGAETYDAFTHSALTGWTIAVAAPVETIEASATQSVVLLAGGVVFALITALLGASVLSRILLRAISTASTAARDLGQGHHPARLPTSIEEVDALNDAFADASERLAGERRARESAEVEREALFAREKDLREAAQRDNAAKDQFLAVLGHELRNPLAAIAGATEVLARGRHDAAGQQRYLQILQRQNRHLRHIVDDLLDVSRLLSGKVVLSLEPLDLAEHVASCVEALRHTERAATHPLEVEASPVPVRADAVRVEQIVNNLVTNAIKFSPAGSPVRVVVREEGEAALLEVIDSGAGIDAELLPRIFEPFVQGPPAAGQIASGLGIGLALVRQLVELHGGSIVAHSAGAGRGARFVVKLPRDVGAAPHPRRDD